MHYYQLPLQHDIKLQDQLNGKKNIDYHQQIQQYSDKTASKDNNKLTSKRNLSFLQQMDLQDMQPQQILARKQQINSGDYQQHKDGNKNRIRPGQTYDKFDLQHQTKQQSECSVCWQSHFNEGRYILECKHLLCNQCFKYWSAVSIKCLLCYKPSSTILTIFHGSTRTIKIKTDNHIPNCEKCLSNNNFHRMYFCDRCKQKCIHTYCSKDLKQEQQEEHWQCSQCSLKSYYQLRQFEQDEQLFEMENDIEAQLHDFIDQSHPSMDQSKTNRDKKRQRKNTQRVRIKDTDLHSRFQKEPKRSKSKKNGNIFSRK